jgi:hypothetical protein
MNLSKTFKSGNEGSKEFDGEFYFKLVNYAFMFFILPRIKAAFSRVFCRRYDGRTSDT